MSNTMKTVYRTTTGMANAAFKKLLFIVLFVAVLASLFTTGLVMLAYRIVT